MNTVFQIINLPVNGSCSGVGPVTISKLFKPGVTKNNKIKVSGKFKDGSGEIEFTLWEPASKNCVLQEGQVYTFGGTFKRGEYNNSPQVTSDDATIAGQGGTPASAPASQQSAQQVQGGAANSITPKDMQIMRQNALTHATALVVACGVKDIFMAQEDVLELARRFTKYSATGSTEPLPSKDEIAKAKAEKIKAEAEAAAKAAQQAAAAAAAAAAQSGENPNDFSEEEENPF